MYDAIGRSPVEWAGRTAVEVREVAERDGSVLVVPVASLEQHGPHMPTITDTLLCTAVTQTGAEAAAEDDVPVLLTPPVWTGQSRHHLPFGGTASLDVRTLLAVLEQVAATTLESGFDALVFVNGHGGNTNVLGTAVQEVAEAQDAEVLGLTYFNLAPDVVESVRESELGGISHAGEMETAMMLHLRPDLVREDRIEAPPHDKPYEGEAEDLMESGYLSSGRPFSTYTEAGAVGRPELATAESGEAFFEAFRDAFVGLLREVHAEHTRRDEVREDDRAPRRAARGGEGRREGPPRPRSPPSRIRAFLADDPPIRRPAGVPRPAVRTRSWPIRASGATGRR